MLGKIRQRRLQTELQVKKKALARKTEMREAGESTINKAKEAATTAELALSEMKNGKAETLLMLQQDNFQCTLLVEQCRRELDTLLEDEAAATREVKEANAVWVRAQQRGDQLNRYSDRHLAILVKRDEQRLLRAIDDSHTSSPLSHG